MNHRLTRLVKRYLANKEAEFTVTEVHCLWNGFNKGGWGMGALALHKCWNFPGANNVALYAHNYHARKYIPLWTIALITSSACQTSKQYFEVVILGCGTSGKIISTYKQSALYVYTHPITSSNHCLNRSMPATTVWRNTGGSLMNHKINRAIWKDFKVHGWWGLSNETSCVYRAFQLCRSSNEEYFPSRLSNWYVGGSRESVGIWLNTLNHSKYTNVNPYYQLRDYEP